MIESLRANYGLDKPLYMQYFIWVSGVVVGDFGWSFFHNEPVAELVGERLALTVVISMFTIVFTYVVAVPIGILSATRQYSLADYAFTTFGFLGLSMPPFLLALILMYVGYQFFGADVGGLFSTEYVAAPWSLAKVRNMLSHMWIPVIVVGTAGTAGIIRVMRGCLLDELRKQYVMTARSKGVKESRVIFKYPVRVSINPIISTIGWMLPQVISGSLIVSVVLSLPTTGNLLLTALRTQDMYLAGSMILLLSFMTIVGTLVSDILLAVADPRIRLEA
jgi:peptide/nickel transport system permease protein